MELESIFLRAQAAEGAPSDFLNQYKSIHYNYNLEFGGNGTIIFNDQSSIAYHVENNTWYDAMDYYPDKSPCCSQKPKLYKYCYGSCKIRDQTTKEICVKCCDQCDQRYIYASGIWVADTYLKMQNDMDITADIVYDLLQLYGNIPDSIYEKHIKGLVDLNAFLKILKLFFN